MNLFKSTIKELTFEKDPDNRWYIVLPEWEGDREDLEMVSGADTLLDYLSEGKDLVTLTVAKIPLEIPRPRVVLTYDHEYMGGAVYRTHHIGGGSLDNMSVWLCKVTKFVYGGVMPRTLSIQ